VWAEVERFTSSGSGFLPHSDLDHFYTYESCEPLGSITYYQGTGRVTPILDGNRALVEWSVVFECTGEELDNCTRLLREACRDGWSRWLSVLERQ
jgi:hypothetical protein